jgi:hypothetical protein
MDPSTSSSSTVLTSVTPAKRKLKGSNGLRSPKQCGAHLPKMHPATRKAVTRFGTVWMRSTGSETTEALESDQRAKGTKLDIDCAGLKGGGNNTVLSQPCGCASLMVVWRHVKDSSMALITSSNADYQRVLASEVWCQMTHAHVRFDEKSSSSDMFLSPAYDPTQRHIVATETSPRPTRGSPLTTAAMKDFIPKPMKDIACVNTYIETFRNGTATLLSPIDWTVPPDLPSKTRNAWVSSRLTCYREFIFYVCLFKEHGDVVNANNRRGLAKDHYTNPEQLKLLPWVYI